MTDAALLKRTIRADGVLLKPSKPLTAIDSEIAAGAGAVPGPPPGHVYSTCERARPCMHAPTVWQHCSCSAEGLLWLNAPRPASVLGLASADAERKPNRRPPHGTRLCVLEARSCDSYYSESENRCRFFL